MSGLRINWPFSKKTPEISHLPDHEPQPPYLTSPSRSATANSPFFQQLPPEIRELILIETFAKKAIHLHAELEYAEERFRLPSPPPQRSRSKFNCFRSNSLAEDAVSESKDEAYWKTSIYHQQIQLPINTPPEKFAVDPNFHPYHNIRPKERWRIVPNSENSGMPSAGILMTTQGSNQSRPTRWKFSSSICHRLAQVSHQPQYADQSTFSGRVSPWDDECLFSAFYPACVHAGTNHPRNCCIGIMGFLLSCKQAYLESSHVLYEQNLFHISGDLMFRRLPYILPRQRLESITTVELVWDLYPKDYVYCKSHNRMHRVVTFERKLEGLEVMMGELARRMPGLRNMWLSLQSSIIDTDLRAEKKDRVDAIEKVLTVIDEGTLKMPKLKDVRVALPDSCFGPCGASSGFPEMPERCISHGTRYVGRWWRDLSGRDVEWKEETRTAADNMSWEALGKGYWILGGKCDLPPPMSFNCGN
ncbi:hypothetical protein B0T21DRAFT_455801 [Apiosordaria backusii]|uniref:DUF7730 domain-containing protein n=1 Tax=Apiosordaria backusii TaxID=314023 RepID=A0AA39ZQ34_9PEZI|nr:hypothetical protein B0T21DRAFT_455801 [Apiosordaria backusii]